MDGMNTNDINSKCMLRSGRTGPRMPPDPFEIVFLSCRSWDNFLNCGRGRANLIEYRPVCVVVARMAANGAPGPLRQSGAASSCDESIKTYK